MDSLKTCRDSPGFSGIWGTERERKREREREREREGEGVNETESKKERKRRETGGGKREDSYDSVSLDANYERRSPSDQ